MTLWHQVAQLPIIKILGSAGRVPGDGIDRCRQGAQMGMGITHD